MLALLMLLRRSSQYIVFAIVGATIICSMSGCSSFDKIQKVHETMDTLQEADRQFTIESTADGETPDDTAAKAWIQRAIVLMPHSDIPYVGTEDDLGIVAILTNRGRYPLLIELLKTALSDPKLSNDPSLLLALGDAEERMGPASDATRTYAAAVVAINKSMTKAGTTIDANSAGPLDRARAEYYGGQRDQAIKDFKGIIESNPDQASIAENDLAYFYSLDKSDLADAKKLATTALADARKGGDDDTVGVYEDTLAWVDHQSGDDQDALFYEQEAASLTPLQADVQYHLGEICQKEDLNALAKVAYTRAIKLDPFFPEAKAALHSLPPVVATASLSSE